MDVPRGNGVDGQRGGEVTQGGVAASVAALERALELDVEAVAAEHRGEARCGARVENGEPPAGATGEADEALGVFLQEGETEARLEPVVRMGGGEEPAEVGVSARRFAKESHVGRRVGGERHLRSGDRSHTECLRRVGELERAADVVVIGERQRSVAELRRSDGQLLGKRGAVEERIGRVAVELDVGHAGARWRRSSSWGPVRASISP